MEISPVQPVGDPAAAPFEQLGGEATFRRFTEVFYERVAEDDLLRPMYPEEDLEPARRRFEMFLVQYWGGPKTYQVERGHPRLRMRHLPFRVTPAARDAWLRAARAGVDAVVADGLLPPLGEQMLWDYLERAAHAMVNSSEE
jgi:hemoglobin